MSSNSNIFKIIDKIFFPESQMKITQEFKNAFHLFEKSNKNYFLTGNAGTGKTTMVGYFRDRSKKKVVILAPTGLAAINARGQTIHSFFNFPPRIITKDLIMNIRNNNRIYKMIDTVVIDEASMMRADMLDGIDMFLRRFGRDKNLPFGGTQIIVSGDLFQLSPVVTSQESNIIKRLYDTPYFFSSNAYKNGNFKKIELTRNFRQNDANFIKLLNFIRNGQVTTERLKVINNQIQKRKKVYSQKKDVNLTTVNKVADEINSIQLDKLPGKEYVYKASIEGNFRTEGRSLPMSLKLKLKKKARVMLVKNGPKWANGSLGVIASVSQKNIKVLLDETKEKVNVSLEKWEHVKYEYDEKEEKIIEKVLGVIRQYPLKLAWAITIHKSQGMTFDKVNIDYSRSPFAHGQTYVALSRCRTLEGLSLSKKIYPNDVIVDNRVIKFLEL